MNITVLRTTQTITLLPLLHKQLSSSISSNWYETLALQLSIANADGQMNQHCSIMDVPLLLLPALAFIP